MRLSLDLNFLFLALGRAGHVCKLRELVELFFSEPSVEAGLTQSSDRLRTVNKRLLVTRDVGLGSLCALFLFWNDDRSQLEVNYFNIWYFDSAWALSVAQVVM